MKYVMSDIHGMYDKYIEMLNKISFSESDKLYILGDIIDRGKDPIKIYKHIIENNNIILLKGNHELMFQEFYEGFENFNYSNWKYNGGSSTKKSLYKEGITYNEFYSFVKRLPFIKVVNNFILTHASTLVLEKRYTDMLSLEAFIEGQEEEFCLWDRSSIGGDTFKDYIHIYGHTPVQMINGSNNILKIENSIYIDCGACFKDGRLACLRLDDMEEFYV